MQAMEIENDNNRLAESYMEERGRDRNEVNRRLGKSDKRI